MLTKLKKKRQTIGIVSTVKNPLYFEDWIRYHQALGIDYMMIFFDDPDTDVQHINLAKKIGNGIIIGQGAIDERLNHTSRQNHNATYGLQFLRGIGCDWCFHIDDDELIYVQNGESPQDLFSRINTSEDIYQYHIHNYEAFRTYPGLEDYNYFRYEKNFWSFGVNAYANGKALANLNAPCNFRIIGQHNMNWDARNFSEHMQHLTLMKPDDLVILHYPFNHFERFYSKCMKEGRPKGSCATGIYKKVWEVNNKDAALDMYLNCVCYYSKDKIKKFVDKKNSRRLNLKKEFWCNHERHGTLTVKTIDSFQDNLFNKWYMYVVKCSDNTLYTGITKDIDRRLYEHNNTKKGAKYTRARRPVRLVHKEHFRDRSSAAKAEHAFKKLTRQKKLSHMQDKTKHRNN